MAALGTKLRHRIDPDGSHRLLWWCPGCKHAHDIRVRLAGAPSPSWEVSGTPELPVFSPSVLVWYGGGKLVDDVWQPDGSRHTTCHCFVGSSGAAPGEIIFLSDCPHELAGKTVPLPPWPANYGGG